MILGKGCCHVWMGDAREAPRMGAMCVATMTKFDRYGAYIVLLSKASILRGSITPCQWRQ